MKLKSIAFLLLTILLCMNTVSAAKIKRTKKNEISRGPYLQIARPESMVIKWQSEKPAISLVEYGESAKNLNQVSVNKVLKTEHELELKNLKPNTKYFYQIYSFEKGEKKILDKDDHSGSYYFKSAPRSGEKKIIRAWILGDPGTVSFKKFRKKFKNVQEDVRDAYYDYDNKHTDLIMILGDNAYNSGTLKEYDKAIFDVYNEALEHSVIYPVFGNHDAGFIEADQGFTSRSYPEPNGVYYDLFSMPQYGESGGLKSGTEAYYSFDYGDAHFIVLDSYDSIWEDLENDNSNFNEIWTNASTKSNKMLRWLEADLKQSKAKWTIVAFHHAIYTNKRGGDNNIWKDWMRTNVAPILEKHGVDLVFAGHIHRYERTYPLKGFHGVDDSFKQAMVKAKSLHVSNKVDKYEQGQGTIYVTAGCAGSSFKRSRREINHPIFAEVLKESGSLVMDISSESLSLKFLNDSGEIKDRFKITRSTSLIDKVLSSVDKEEDIEADEKETAEIEAPEPSPESIKNQEQIFDKELLKQEDDHDGH